MFAAAIILINKKVDCPEGKALLISDDPFRDFNVLTKYFKPFKVDEHIIIKPTWEEYISDNKDDLIIEIDDQEVVGEIKTIKAEAFDIRKDTSTGADSHVVQLLIYMKALGLEEGFFIYENKNNHEIAVIPLAMSEENDEYISMIFDWMREVRKAWEDGKNIKRPFKESSYECKYCPIKDDCYSRPDGRTKIEPLEIRSI
jgi:hypothetical protein